MPNSHPETQEKPAFNFDHEARKLVCKCAWGDYIGNEKLSDNQQWQVKITSEALRLAYETGISRSMSSPPFVAAGLRWLYEKGVATKISAKTGHALDDTGTVRKVKGKLPIMADGGILGLTSREDVKCKCCGQDTPAEMVWHPDFLDRPAQLRGDFHFVGGSDRPIGEFYGDREAACAASRDREE